MSAPGFASQAQGFQLDVSQIQALMFRLKPGAATATVEVTDAAPIVDTTTSSVGAPNAPPRVWLDITDGWFTDAMPDLNQENPLVAR